jgi:hypothetical protein
VTGDWRRLHNEELHNLYASQNIINVIKSRRIRWVGQVECILQMRNAYKMSLGKPEGGKPLGRPRCRWEDNIRIDLIETEWRGVD